LPRARFHGDNRFVHSRAHSAGATSKKAAVKLSQILSAPNQLTLVRLAFLPFIIIKLVEGHYGWALILFMLAGLSDGLDGLLARLLKQQTLLGQYLDPIADKMLLSSVFLVLSILHKIPWKFTVLVFSRDVCIVLISGLLYTIAGLRDFRPSIFGKANTVAQLAAVVFVMLFQVDHTKWVWVGQKTFLRATFAFTIISALHYVYLVGHRLRAAGHSLAAEPK
jgi:cardiolipin synthase (CMP-forming)